MQNGGATMRKPSGTGMRRSSMWGCSSRSSTRSGYEGADQQGQIQPSRPPRAPFVHCSIFYRTVQHYTKKLGLKPRTAPGLGPRFATSDEDEDNGSDR